MVKSKETKCKLFEAEFTDLPITTQTVIVITNFSLDIEKFFKQFEVIPIVPNYF